VSTPQGQETYRIDGKHVPQKEFKRLESSLKGQEHWSCSETQTGGVVDYESVGPDGRRYHVSHETDGDRGVHEIRAIR